MKSIWRLYVERSWANLWLNACTTASPFQGFEWGLWWVHFYHWTPVREPAHWRFPLFILNLARHPSLEYNWILNITYVFDLDWRANALQLLERRTSLRSKSFTHRVKKLRALLRNHLKVGSLTMSSLYGSWSPYRPGRFLMKLVM